MVHLGNLNDDVLFKNSKLQALTNQLSHLLKNVVKAVRTIAEPIKANIKPITIESDVV